ncbi:hypothetical protein K501DRAFT_269119 [Backusella circina FSU 941]|nr:hypothetical protein K501DRAFT_269119 [Backusella circina FSU 941]
MKEKTRSKSAAIQQKDNDKAPMENPTEYIKRNLNEFNYHDFCQSYLQTFKDKEDSIRVLSKILGTIRNHSTEGSYRKKIEELLNDLSCITDDKRVELLFQKEAAESRDLKEQTYSQSVGGRVLEEIGSPQQYYADRSSSSSEGEATNSSQNSDTNFKARESTSSSDSSQGIIQSRSIVLKDYLVSSNISNMIDLADIKAKWVLKSGLISRQHL